MEYGAQPDVLDFDVYHVSCSPALEGAMFHVSFLLKLSCLHVAWGFKKLEEEKQIFIQKTFPQIGSLSLFLYCKY